MREEQRSATSPAKTFLPWLNFMGDKPDVFQFTERVCRFEETHVKHAATVQLYGQSWRPEPC
jgi:hypothetical protein